MAIRVLTVDDHPLIREGIAAVLRDEQDIELAGEACGGLEAVEQFRALRPDVTLMDLKMPDLHGADAIARIRKEFPGAKVVVLTTYKGDVQALRAFKAGASGYLLKSMLRVDLLDTIRQVHAGKVRVPPEIASEIAFRVSSPPLTEREVEVLRWVSRGSSNKEIAGQLRVTEETIKAHMKHIMVKLETKDRAHSAVIAMRRGYLLD